MKPIKRKILTPFVLLMIGVPLTAMLILNAFLRLYTISSTKKELKNASLAFEQVLKEDYFDQQGQLRQGTDIHLPAVLQSELITSHIEILIYDKDKNLIYPKSPPAPLTEAKAGAWLKSLMTQNGRASTRLVGTTRYLAYGRALDTGVSGLSPGLVCLSTASGFNRLIRTANLVLVAVTLLGIAIAYAISSWMLNKTARQLRALCCTAQAIGDGQFEQISPESEGNILEFVQLSRSINEMSAKLLAYDRAQKAFLQNASHELRTPLMSIQGYAEGIEKGLFPDTRQAAGIIDSESRRLNALVDQLLTLSRIESQSYAQTAAPLQLDNALKEYAQRLQGAALKENKELVLQLDSDPATVLADENLLSQAVSNIVSNCIRYARSRVTVTLRVSEGWAGITVSDDGDGIAPQDLPHLFERFYKGKTGNFGLGLAIAKSAAETMGGAICAGNSGGGAVFTLSLPLLAQGENTTAPQTRGRPRMGKRIETERKSK